jgi:predicted transcriptional regulator YheO
MENLEKLSKYIPVVHFIAEIIGKNCEVVLHDISKPDNSIVEIANGHISGRKVNGPITDLALKILKDKNYVENSYICNYESIGKGNKTFRSSSYFIKDDQNEIIGMICVNVDLTDLLKARSVLDDAVMIANLNNHGEQPKPALNLHVKESFEDNIEDLLLSLIKGVLSESDIEPGRMSPNEKMDIVRKLNDKGVFLLKGGVSEVARHLDASEATIYRYLNKIK